MCRPPAALLYAAQALYLSLYGLYFAGARNFMRLPFLPITLPAALESALPPVFGEMFSASGIPLLIFFVLAAVGPPAPQLHVETRAGFP